MKGLSQFTLFDHSLTTSYVEIMASPSWGKEDPNCDELNVVLSTYTFNHWYFITLINLPEVEGYSCNGSKLNSSTK